MNIAELLIRMASVEDNIIFGTVRGINHFDLDNVIICTKNITNLIFSINCT